MKSISLDGIRLTVADNTVCPSIGDLNLECVLPELESARNIDAIRRFRENTEGPAVHGDFGQILDVTEINGDVRTLRKPVGRCVDRLSVSALAGEILDAFIPVIAPGS